MNFLTTAIITWSTDSYHCKKLNSSQVQVTAVSGFIEQAVSLGSKTQFLTNHQALKS